MNKRDVRATEFAMQREWAEKQSSDELRRRLSDGSLAFGLKTAAREVLRTRGEGDQLP